MMLPADREFALARCVSVVRETHDVKTFTWRFEDGRHLGQVAGQHVTFEVPLEAGTQFRCYTVSSAPRDESATFSITAKEALDGAVSRWLHRRANPGTAVRVAGPSGTFVAPTAREPLLLIAGGVGITPLIAMVRYWRSTMPDNGPDVVLVQCVRTPGDVLFHDELIELARGWPSFRVHEVISRAPGGGRLTAASLARLAPDVSQRSVYCCGPEPFMRDVRALLLSMGVPEAKYHEESFRLPTMAKRLDPAGVDAFRVIYARAVQEGSCGAEATLLDAARRAGIVIPNGCRVGVCGTCRVRLLAGTVDMTDAGGIAEDEVAAGYVLACCSRPTSDVELDV